MGEKLKGFIEYYDKKASEQLAMFADKLEKFKAAREVALKLTTPVNEQYKTLGELVAKMLPETGGVDGELMKEIYFKLPLEKKEKDVVTELFKIKDAPAKYAKAELLKTQGGEYYFNRIISGLNQRVAESRAGGSKLTIDDILGDGGDESRKNFLSIVEDITSEYKIEGPGGVQVTSLYEAALENRSTPNPGAEKSPINETPEKKEESKSTAPEASAVNPEKAAESAKTEVTSTASKVTSTPPEVPKEIEKKEEKTAINVNLEAPAASTAPLIQSPSNTSVINQGLSSSTSTNVENVTNTNKEEVTQASTTISPATTVNTTSSATSSQINDQSISNTKSKASSSVGGWMQIINELTAAAGIKGGFADETEKALKSALGMPTINEGVEATSTKAGVEKISATNEPSSINEDEEETGEKITKTSVSETTINEKSSKESGAAPPPEAFAEVARRFGINVESLSSGKPTLISEDELDVTEKVSSEKTSVPQQMEISKTSQTLPQETGPTSAPTPPVVLPETGTASATETGSTAATQSVKTTEGAPESSQKPGDTKTSIDITSLENRLMRIEHLLSSTLEVKIVD